MSTQLQQRHAEVDRALSDERNRKFLEDLWVQLHKHGGYLPHSDELFKLYLGLQGEQCGPGPCPAPITPEQNALMCTILDAVGFLCQLAVAKERM